MKRTLVISAPSPPMKINWWRVALIALGAMILSGCQAIDRRDDRAVGISGDPYALDSASGVDPSSRQMAPVVVLESAGSFDFGDEVYSETFSDLGEPASVSCANPGCDSVIVREAQRNRNLPKDEYLCDGGDGLYTSYPGLSEERGLEPTDTVAQYNTDDGESHIVASNRTCVYAPRFTATRRISNVQNREVIARVGGLHERVTPDIQAIQINSSDVRRNLAAEGQIGTTIRHELYDSTRGLLVDDVDVVWEWGRRLLPFENLHTVRTGQLDGSEVALLEQATAAAHQWESIEALELTIDGRPAQTTTEIGQPSSVYLFETTPGDSRLQLVKLASTGSALPGDTVHFTVRFDNRGEVPISNIKIVDSLATRLEYIADSEECTLRALFFAQDNAAGSSKLRWEIREQLKTGEGGVIRFSCRVR